MPCKQSFTCRPIGILLSPYKRRIDAPHQGTVLKGSETGELAVATLELADWLEEKVLQDLNGFDRVWLIFVFHQSEGWKSSVKPPRADRSGVFTLPVLPIAPTPLACQRWSC